MSRKKQTYYSLICSIELGLLLLCFVPTACTDDKVPESPASQGIYILSATRAYQEPISRAGLPAGFSEYIPSSDVAIDAFITSNEKPVGRGFFTYNSSNQHWYSNIVVEEDQHYYIYGIFPKYGTPSIAPLKNDENQDDYQTGAVLTLTGIPSVTKIDICVIVGVLQGDRNFTDIHEVENLRTGRFDFIGRAPSEGNFVYVLFDHLYSGLQLQFRINEEYAALRTIKIRSVSLSATEATPDVTLRRAADSDANNVRPMTVNWTPSTGTTSLTIFSDEDGKALTTTYNNPDAPFIDACHVGSNMSGTVNLTTIYDVYDRKGNLIRANQEATNNLTTKLAGLAPGQKKTLQITVNPTYLYVLSDDDLNNPTFSID